MNEISEPIERFVCPGEKAPISWAVHLGRLSNYYQACRKCPHRDQTGSISSSRQKRLRQTERCAAGRPSFRDEDVSGVLHNEMTPELTRRVAIAFGTLLRQTEQNERTSTPVVVVAGDGRPLVPEVVASVCEGLRWSAVNVIDIGPATAACVAFAVERLKTEGGLLIGNPEGRVQTVGLRFWTRNACPMSAERIGPIWESEIDRPVRKYGEARRFLAEVPYLALFEGSYHALRPLRFLLDTAVCPMVRYIDRLLEPTGCEAIVRRCRPEELAELVRDEGLHFAIRIDDDGQRCDLFDERAEPIDPERLLQRIVCHLVERSESGSTSTIVLEHETSPTTADRFERLGLRVERAKSRRAAIDRAMRRSEAIFGGGPSGRFWYTSIDQPPSPDALRTLTLLLEILSQSDRPLSEILDVDVPIG